LGSQRLNSNTNEDSARARKVAEEKVYGEFPEWYYSSRRVPPENDNGQVPPEIS